MPELPEVESYRTVVEKHCLGKIIKKIKIIVPELLTGTTTSGFIKSLKGTRFTQTRRVGKYLFVQSSHKDWIFFHFGLTGDLSFGKNEVPKYTAVQFEFSKGILFFADMRKFGRFGLVESPEIFLDEKNWGPDALEITKSGFIQRIKKKHTAIKSVLMDQKIIAGIGNEYSDEILFRSQIHPESMASDIDDNKLSELFKITRATLNSAIRLGAERSKMNKFFFVVNRKKGIPCSFCNGIVKSKTIGGRTSYYCEACQKKY